MHTYLLITTRQGRTIANPGVVCRRSGRMAFFGARYLAHMTQMPVNIVSVEHDLAALSAFARAHGAHIIHGKTQVPPSYFDTHTHTHMSEYGLTSWSLHGHNPCVIGDLEPTVPALVPCRFSSRPHRPQRPHICRGSWSGQNFPTKSVAVGTSARVSNASGCQMDFILNPCSRIPYPLGQNRQLSRARSRHQVPLAGCVYAS